MHLAATGKENGKRWSSFSTTPQAGNDLCERLETQGSLQIRVFANKGLCRDGFDTPDPSPPNVEKHLICDEERPSISPNKTGVDDA